MTKQHPITPPPELVEQWASEFYGTTIAPGEASIAIANQAARWGADQELEACCEWLHEWTQDKHPGGIENLRAARRPKPPSLKEQALEALMKADGADHPVPVLVLPLDEAAVIRRALEALPE